MRVAIGLLFAVSAWAQFGPASAVVSGNGAPVAAQCTNANNVGRVWARKNGAAVNSTFYVCSNTGVGTFAWELVGSGVAPSGGAVGGASAVAAGQVLYGTGAGVAGTSAGLAYNAADVRLGINQPTGTGGTGLENLYKLRINMGTAPGYGLSIANGAIDPWFHVNSNGIGFIGNGTTIPFWSIEDEPNFVRELRAHMEPSGSYSFLWAKSSDSATKPNDLQLWANRDIVIQAGRSNTPTDNNSRVIIQGSAGTTFTQWGSSGSNNSRTTIDYVGGARLYQYTSAGSLVNLLNAGGFGYYNGGRFAVGKDSDDGVNALQVNGSAQAGSFVGSAVLFASLPASTNGTFLYCSDCTVANPCASGGTGAFARRLNAAWVCSDGGGGGGTPTACEIVIGDPGAATPVLADDNDTPAVCANVSGTSQTITAIACYANAGSPSVNPIITGGGGTSILSAPLTCGTGSYAAGTLSGTPALANGATIDANIASAGGAAKYIVIRIVRQ